jgi:hypothetical protein
LPGRHIRSSPTDFDEPLERDRGFIRFPPAKNLLRT